MSSHEEQAFTDMSAVLNRLLDGDAAARMVADVRALANVEVAPESIALRWTLDED